MASTGWVTEYEPAQVIITAASGPGYQSTAKTYFPVANINLDLKGSKITLILHDSTIVTYAFNKGATVTWAVGTDGTYTVTIVS